MVGCSAVAAPEAHHLPVLRLMIGCLILYTSSQSCNLHTIIFTCAAIWSEHLMLECRGHLNMATTVKSAPGDMEGILGSSLYLAQTGQKSSSDQSFSDEGYEEEYAVGDIFEGLQVQSTSASRRRLIEGSPFAGIPFPVTAHYM